MTVLIPPGGLRESRASNDLTTHAADASEAIQLELKAMQSIAGTLAALPDEAARDRVLAWVNACSRSQVVHPQPQQPWPGPSSTARVQPAHAPSPRSPTAEHGLSLEGVESFFDDGRPSPGQFPPSPLVASPPRPRLWPRMVGRFRRWR